MSDLEERVKTRKANKKRILSHKKPTILESKILSSSMPEEIRKKVMEDYNQLYYNQVKENRTTRTERADEVLMDIIFRTLKSYQ